MARRKKNEPEFIICSVRTNYTKLSVKTGVSVEELRALNPDIRFGIIGIPAGRRVRIR